TPGTHGNLGDTSVSDGDDLPIPPALGQCEFELEPITAALKLNSPERGHTGFAGVVVALIEENSNTDEAAAAGHEAFNRALEKGINEVVKTLRRDAPDPSPARIEQLKNEVADRIKDAVVAAEFWFPFDLLNADALIGAGVFFADKS